jgi:transposase
VARRFACATRPPKRPRRWKPWPARGRRRHDGSNAPASSGARQGETPPAIASALGLDAETVRRRIRRFNAEGLAALEDHHRSWRPAAYSAEEIAAVIAAALTSPRSLGLLFASWTLDRLAAYLLEQKGIAIRRSRIDEILLREGLRWRWQETWFGERVDPEFAEKRGGSGRSTPRRPRAA